MYKKKVKGITLVETMTSLGIMGIFMLLSFPVIKIIYRTENFFKRKAEKGSLIFLEIPYVKNEVVFSKYIIYRFYTGSLEVMECSLLNKKIFVERAENILEEVEGYFEKDGKGIVINLQIRNENGKIKKILRGYELVGKKYE